ncbi:alpha/beta hydrolase family protein [Prevotella sp.]|uniref:alpha/beta hydrolase family protein n=1 Tax=Prevotella sp. TaxID=59823 RepID=UPI003076C35E
MKKKRLMSLLLILIPLLTSAQDLKGAWKGLLEVGPAKLNIVFHIHDDNNVTMDSPDQGAMELPTKVVCMQEDSISVTMPRLGAQYAGKLVGEEINGTFSQMGHSFPLILKRGEIKMNRPQTPQPPFEYTTQEVVFHNKGIDAKTGLPTEGGEAWLGGTLTYPKGFKTGMPVILMVTGSGQQNRDEELMGHKPFLVIADYLARHGIATLRYDDRGVGKSTGNMAMITLQSNMLDAEAGIDYLKSTKKFGKIGVLGHSEGGIISYMLAARGKADFVVSLAGPVLPGDSVLLMQNRDLLTAAGLDKDNVEKYATALSRVFKYRMSEQKMKFSDKPESLVPMLTMDIALLPELRKNLIETVKMVDSPWLVSYLKYDPATDIRKINSPVMLIIGDNDKQVNATANIQAAENILPKAVKAKSLLKAYPTLNHLFQPSETGSPGEYAKIETTISEEVLDDITSWIIKTAKQ